MGVGVGVAWVFLGGGRGGGQMRFISWRDAHARWWVVPGATRLSIAHTHRGAALQHHSSLLCIHVSSLPLPSATCSPPLPLCHDFYAQLDGEADAVGELFDYESFIAGPRDDFSAVESSSGEPGGWVGVRRGAVGLQATYCKPQRSRSTQTCFRN